MVVEKNNFMENLIFYLSILIAIILIIVLIVIKINVPEFKLTQFILSLILVIGFFSGIILFSWYYNKRNKEKQGEDFEEFEKIPRPVTLEQCREIAKKATINPEYADYIQGCKGETVELFGKAKKSLIYTYISSGYYSGDTIYIIINMHYPNDRRTILINPTKIDVETAKLRLATQLEPTPDVREIRNMNPLLGTEQTIIETTQKVDEEKKKEDEKSL